MAYKIVHNRDYNNNEVYFDKAPAPEVRTALKNLKMRWNPQRFCWYGYATRDQITDAICGIARITVPPSMMSEQEFIDQYTIDPDRPVIWVSNDNCFTKELFAYMSARELEDIRKSAAKYEYRKLLLKNMA